MLLCVAGFSHPGMYSADRTSSYTFRNQKLMCILPMALVAKPSERRVSEKVGTSSGRLTPKLRTQVFGYWPVMMLALFGMQVGFAT